MIRSPPVDRTQLFDLERDSDELADSDVLSVEHLEAAEIDLRDQD